MTYKDEVHAAAQQLSRDMNAIRRGQVAGLPPEVRPQALPKYPEPVRRSER
jgi:hypothetical protein